MKKLSIYLAGGMEAEVALGAGWRSIAAKELHMDFEVLSPVEFEPKQLAGLRPNILPKEFEDRLGNKITPKHWHELKKAKHGTRLYDRFITYMHRIIRYDINIVEKETDIVLCNWTPGTAKGAGTHAELTAAFLADVPVYIIECPESPIPAWALGCSTFIFSDLESAIAAIKADYIA